MMEYLIDIKHLSYDTILKEVYQFICTVFTSETKHILIGISESICEPANFLKYLWILKTLTKSESSVIISLPRSISPQARA